METHTHTTKTNKTHHKVLCLKFESSTYKAAATKDFDIQTAEALLDLEM